MVKEFLSQKGLNFKTRDVSVDRSAAQELVNISGQMGVPVTVIGDQTIIGFDRARLESVIAQSGATQRPIFGAAIADASTITAQRGSSVVTGAYIGKVRPGSVAEYIGLAPGDIVTGFNMQRISNAGDLERALSGMTKGNRFSLVFLRGEKEHTTEGML
jgi:S1-C subfamily serine protease